MRPFERREANAYPYFKLSVWDACICVWKVIQKNHPTEAEARAAANKAGQYRISRIEESGKTELEPFAVA